MSQNWKIDGALAQTEQQPRVIKIEASARPDNARLRVAAYTRVSSDSDDQLHSFAAQNQYYTTLIVSKAEWRLVGIYADEGITGTSTAKRDDFNRMMADCRRGLIDQILVKSISRFARNTKDCLEAIRELKALGVNVRFEREGINTADVSSELMTSIYAAFAQRESESISGNMRWSYQKRMENGTFNTCKAPYGYRLRNGQLVIEEQEATVVRQIFAMYLSGSSRQEIADHLVAQRIPPRQGIAQWKATTISYILSNERYGGNTLLAKKITTDNFPHRKVRNYGERKRYFVQDSHPAILDKGVFERAAALTKRRKSPEGTQTEEHPLRGKLYCGCCGSIFKRRFTGGIEYWVCKKHFKDKTQCPVPQIQTKNIESAFCRFYYKMKHQGVGILTEMLQNFQMMRRARMLHSPDVVSINTKISQLSSQNQMLAMLNQQGLVDPDIFISRSNDLAREIIQAEQKREKLLSARNDMKETYTRDLIELLDDGPDLLASFDPTLFAELVDRIIVDSNDSVRLCLKNGLELRECMERTVR